MQTFIERLRARLADPERMIDRPGRETPIVFAPASAEAIRQAERELGFPLPKTLREVYSEVANGGIGPSMGLLGVAGGATTEGENAVQLYHTFAAAADFVDEWEMSEPAENFAWPDRMLPICYYGCTVYECLDCTMSEPAVYTVDLDDREGGLTFEKTARSLTAWFERWLKKTNSPEPRWLRAYKRKYANVKQANFSGGGIRTSQMPYLARLKHLENLCLSGCPINDDSLSVLAQLPQLRILNLHDTPITGAGLVHLAGLEHLVGLDIGESQVRDEAFACLGSLPLEFLRVGDTHITDAGLVHLHAIETLRTLDLTRTRVSPGARAALQAAIPACEIEWWPP